MTYGQRSPPSDWGEGRGTVLSSPPPPLPPLLRPLCPVFALAPSHVAPFPSTLFSFRPINHVFVPADTYRILVNYLPDLPTVSCISPTAFVYPPHRSTVIYRNLRGCWRLRRRLMCTTLRLRPLTTLHVNLSQYRAGEPASEHL